MAIAYFEPQEEEDVPSSQEKMPISQTLSHISKNKDTLLSQTFKVEEKKVSLLFLIFGPGAEIWPLRLLNLRRRRTLPLSPEKRPISLPLCHKLKK